MTSRPTPEAAKAMDRAVAEFTREHGPLPEPYTFDALAAADPRLPSTELGELVGLEYTPHDGSTHKHAFARPFPLLSYHIGGLLISGGAYSIEADRLVNRRSSKIARARRASVRPEDARAVDAAIARYKRDHWGQSGPRDVVRLPAADPARMSRRFAGLVAVIYRTKKGKDKELTDYRHAFTRPRPTLSYHEAGLIISGGVYHVTERGIID